MHARSRICGPGRRGCAPAEQHTFVLHVCVLRTYVHIYAYILQYVYAYIYYNSYAHIFVHILLYVYVKTLKLNAGSAGLPCLEGDAVRQLALRLRLDRSDLVYILRTFLHVCVYILQNANTYIYYNEYTRAGSAGLPCLEGDAVRQLAHTHVYYTYIYYVHMHTYSGMTYTI